MTLIHTDLFCTLAIFSRFVCDTVVKLPITDNSEHHTMIHLEVLALFVEVQPQPSGLTSLFCTRVHLFPHAVCSFCLFSYRSIRCDCWYHLVSHCLFLVWTKDRSSVLASMWYFIQVVLHCFGCLMYVPWRFVSEPITWQCKYLAWSTLVKIYQALGQELARVVILVVGPLYADEKQNSSFQAT